MDCIIFSKDRACQLDLLLRSISLNLPISSVTMLYTSSNSFFESGYDKLRAKFNAYTFIRETSFKDDVLQIIGNNESDFILSLADDTIIHRKVESTSLQDLLYHLSNKEIVSGSLRHGLSRTYCYMNKKDITIPDFIEGYPDSCLVWNWATCGVNFGWGYPHAMDGSIYNRLYLLNLIERLKFHNPSTLEGRMNKNRNYNKPYMISFNQMKAINIANNIVQETVPTNRGGNQEDYSTTNMNDKFLKGYVIRLSDFIDISIPSFHLEKDYTFDIG